MARNQAMDNRESPTSTKHGIIHIHNNPTWKFKASSEPHTTTSHEMENSFLSKGNTSSNCFLAHFLPFMWRFHCRESLRQRPRKPQLPCNPNCVHCSQNSQFHLYPQEGYISQNYCIFHLPVQRKTMNTTSPANVHDWITQNSDSASFVSQCSSNTIIQFMRYKSGSTLGMSISSAAAMLAFVKSSIALGGTERT